MKVEHLKREAERKFEENRKFFARLKRKNSRQVDEAFQRLDEEVFSEIDCLTCANCCKTTSPIFYENDIDRLSKALRIKPGDFVDKYLRIDSDKDYVLKVAPCPFLGADNYCSVYEARPKACREYPHTNRKKMVQVLDLALKNTSICPAVFEIVEKLKKLNF
jgi:uncharacterized protein